MNLFCKLETKTAATDVCHLLKQRLSKFPSSSSLVHCTPPPLCKQWLCLTLWRWTQQAAGDQSAVVTVLQRQIPGFDAPCCAWVGGGRVCSCSSPVLWRVWLCEAARVSTAPFHFQQLLTHTSPFYLSSPSLSMFFTAFLTQQRQTKKWGGWGGGGVSWSTEGSLSGISSYGFLQACILNTLWYNIFLHLTEGCRGGTHFSPTSFFFFCLDPFSSYALGTP